MDVGQEERWVTQKYGHSEERQPGPLGYGEPKVPGECRGSRERPQKGPDSAAK